MILFSLVQIKNVTSLSINKDQLPMRGESIKKINEYPTSLNNDDRIPILGKNYQKKYPYKKLTDPTNPVTGPFQEFLKGFKEALEIGGASNIDLIKKLESIYEKGSDREKENVIQFFLGAATQNLVASAVNGIDNIVSSNNGDEVIPVENLKNNLESVLFYGTLPEKFSQSIESINSALLALNESIKIYSDIEKRIIDFEAKSSLRA